MDLATLFGTEALDAINPGLFVAVYDGHVQLMQGDATVDIGGGESAFGDGKALARLDKTPEFVLDDIYPRPSRIDPATLQLLEQVEECRVQ